MSCTLSGSLWYTYVHALEDPQSKSESVECGFTSSWLSMHAPQAHQACNEKGDSECKGRWPLEITEIGEQTGRRILVNDGHITGYSFRDWTSGNQLIVNWSNQDYVPSLTLYSSSLIIIFNISAALSSSCSPGSTKVILFVSFSSLVPGWVSVNRPLSELTFHTDDSCTGL